MIHWVAPWLAILLSAAPLAGKTITVTSAGDTGTGTLRQAILDAAAGDTINFSLPSGTTSIILTSDQLLINKNLTITGPGANLLSVVRGRAPFQPFFKFRIFEIDSGNVTISGLTISNGIPAEVNTPIGDSGGGILNQSSGLVTISHCVISGNSSAVNEGSGGGIDNSGTMEISNSTISGNSTTRYGGGIDNSGPMFITNSTVSNNSAVSSNANDGYGGGINNVNGNVNSPMTITNSTISNNSASQVGGGIMNGQVAPTNFGCMITITNSTISGNSSSGTNGGGGIYNGPNYGGPSNTITLTNSTISANSANQYGGGVVNFDVTTARNTIIAKNTSGIGDPDFSGTLTSHGFNLIGNKSGATITSANADQIGTPGAPIDPLLGPLQDNGGPTETQALSTSSPAVDKGQSSGSSTDQRGFTRPVNLPAIFSAPGGDASDIGAYEVQTSSPSPTPTATPTATPAATPTATPTGTPAATPTATPTTTPTPTSGSLGNISTRLQVGTGNNVLFAGFIIQGNASKTVLIRSAGPSLTSFGLPGALANPQLELHDANNTIGTNDNWQTTQLGGVITSDQVAAIQNSGAAPLDPAEPAIIATLPPGSYTAIVQGVGGTQGVATVEVYDLIENNGAILANISTRGFIQTGDNVMIGGFIVVDQPIRVLVRATGPSLASFGISNALANPQLELHDANGAIAGNDDWQTTQLGGIITSDQSAAIQNSGLAPGNPAESAIIATLAPGNYTAIAQGVNGGTGVGVVEVFALP